QVAIDIARSDVAGAKPAVRVEHGRGRLRLLEVARHHLRSADPHFTELSRSQLGAASRIYHFAFRVGDEEAGRSAAPPGGVDGCGRNDRARLGEPVSLGNEALQPVAAGLFNAGVERRGSRVDRLQVVRVIAVEQGWIGQRWS